MKYLFSSTGLAALKSFIAIDTLFAFDLDGTLAPIVPDPSAIRIRHEVRQKLIRLDALAPLAVITGRSRPDALLHLGFMPRFLVGNHGAEGLPGEESISQGFTRLCREWKLQLNRILPDMSARGIVLEDKGESLALHYRQAPDHERARESIRSALAGLTPPPRSVAGIFVKNLMPSEAPDKGAALETLIRHQGCRRAIFVGDDITDEDVFRLDNPSVLGIRVSRGTKSAAPFYLRGQQEIGRLLDKIIARLERCPVSLKSGSEPYSSSRRLSPKPAL